MTPEYITAGLTLLTGAYVGYLNYRSSQNKDEVEEANHDDDSKARYLETVLSDVNDLREQFRQLNEFLSTLQKEISKMQKEVVNLTLEKGEIELKNKQLLEENNKLQGVISELRDALSRLEKKITTFGRELAKARKILSDHGLNLDAEIQRLGESPITMNSVSEDFNEEA